VSDAPAGAPPFKGRIAAERELLEALWYASQTFREEGDGGLEGCKIACRGVARFLAVRHRNPELAAPFLALHAALQDVDRGVPPELFSTDPTLRKRSRSSHRKHLQMLASVALDVLMLLGDIQDHAAREVARAVQRWPSMEPSSVTPLTIKNWRNQILAQSPAERAHFDQLRAYLVARPDPRDEVAKLLAEPPGVAKT
jgi:hypothetical protein